jgi:hypothetical protein
MAIPGRSDKPKEAIMSKYQIKHICGHVVTHNIVGTNVHGERQRKAEWLETTLCTECYRKQQQEQAVLVNKDLLALTGSEKQIAWAEKIRAEANASMDNLRTLLAKEDRTKNPAMYDKAAAIINDTMAVTESRFWIDNRDAMIGSNAWFRRELSK